MYVFNHELSSPPASSSSSSNSGPVYQTFKQGDGFGIFTCKAKSTRNPLYKWTIGKGSITEFAFSPCGHFLAVVSQDGYLRLFNYDHMELEGIARSYFGGLTCVAWSPDGKYVVCGGEDDLLTLYSVAEKRVVCRGQGHKSWLTRVAFDEFNVSYGDDIVSGDGLDFSGSDEEGAQSSSAAKSASRRHHTHHHHHQHHHHLQSQRRNSPSSPSERITCYRIGSVGEDTHLCLWDVTEDLLNSTTKTANSQQVSASSLQSVNSDAGSNNSSLNHHHTQQPPPSPMSVDSGVGSSGGGSGSGKASTEKSSLSQRFAALNFGDKNKEHKKKDKSGSSSHSSDKSSKGGKSSSNNSSSSIPVDSHHSGNASSSNASILAPGGSRITEYVKMGSWQCPRINQVPLVEPLVSKKISHERLTSLTFLEDCLVTACQDGYVCTWARPGKMVSF